MKHLFVSLAGNSWGRTIMARTIASDLIQAGDDVVFLFHESLTHLMNGANFSCEIVPQHMGSLGGLMFEQTMRSHNPDTVVLSDYFTNANFLHTMGISPSVLLVKDASVFTLDVWDCDKTGLEVDMFIGYSRQLGPGKKDDLAKQFASIPHKLKPVPVIGPQAKNGSFCNLPSAVKASTDTRIKTRQAMGFSNSVKVVLFCTAGWQHAQYREWEVAGRFAASLPQLIGEYLHSMEQVHLVHIGPQAYNMSTTLDDRYHWVPSCSPDDFAGLMASIDLLLTTNISATTIAKAMVSEVPVLVLQNSFQISNAKEVEDALGRKVSDRLQHWLEKSVPIFPFALWPLGYHKFLSPVLRNNPYLKALEVVELLDELQVNDALDHLLFDQVARADHLHRQTGYLGQVGLLPTGAQVIQTAMAA